MIFPHLRLDYQRQNELYNRIWRGGYPALHRNLNRNLNHYFDSYLQTYLERDVQALTQVGDKGAFMALMQSAAARTGQQPYRRGLESRGKHTHW